MECESALQLERLPNQRAEKRGDQVMERWLESLGSLMEYHVKVPGQEHRECH